MEESSWHQPQAETVPQSVAKIQDSRVGGFGGPGVGCGGGGGGGGRGGGNVVTRIICTHNLIQQHRAANHRSFKAICCCSEVVVDVRPEN